MGDLAVQGRAAERRPIEHVPSLPPLVGDYEARRRTFSWEGARAWLQGDAEGHLNMAHEAVDRHAEGDLADAVAIRFLRLDGGADLRETFELVERLGKRAGFRIEDDDADQLRTVDSATSFLARRSAGARH